MTSGEVRRRRTPHVPSKTIFKKTWSSKCNKTQK
jgi:hypothetical protein